MRKRKKEILSNYVFEKIPKSKTSRFHKARMKCLGCGKIFYSEYSGRLYCDSCLKKKGKGDKE